MLRAAKKNYFNSLTSANSKQFWKTVKLVSKQQESIPALTHDNVNAVTDEEKSNMLNRYFSTCWNRSESPLTDPPDNDCVEYDETCTDYLLCMMDEIVQLINGLDVSKANGPDGISARMLKATSNIIAPSLTKLSISTGHFPKLWKEARVVPIPKSTAKKSPSGYRPISLVSIPGKLLEKHFHLLVVQMELFQPFHKSSVRNGVKENTADVFIPFEMC